MIPTTELPTAGRRRAPAPRKSMSESVERALERGRAHLLSLQRPEGFWWAPLEANATMTAEYLLLTHVLGVGEPGRWRLAADALLSEQLEDGGWPLYHGGPSDLNATVESYVALKLAGLPATDPRMVRARTRALALGGIPATRVFTRVWLTLVGEWDWADLPALPPELILQPQGSPLHVGEFACWARQTVVPMSVLFGLRPVRPLPAHARVPELMPEVRRAPAPEGPALSWRGAFRGLDRVLRLYEKRPVRALRAAALAAAERWILERQERDGSWGGIQPPWVYSLMALSALGYDNDHPVMRRGLEGLEGFGVQDERGWWMQSCISPVWDTALAMLALRDAGLPPDHEALVRAGEWLLDRQITRPGDWALSVEGEPGGWAFEFENDNYPDTDDTAVVLLALRRVRLPDEVRRRKALERGFRWLLAMQSENGGWGAFDKDNTSGLVGQIPFCDFGEVTDPPSEDVTAHVVECLARFGYDDAFPPVARALAYLRRTQEPDGSWFGRWGVNYVYGTGAVLPALEALGEGGSPEARRGADWLSAVQNPDGGWGESCASYDHPAWKARGESTPSQTAWALMGLLSAGRGGSAAARRGAEWLVAEQGGDGAWSEEAFTGTGFPRDFLLRYQIYRDVFPLMALGRYRDDGA